MLACCVLRVCKPLLPRDSLRQATCNCNGGAACAMLATGALWAAPRADVSGLHLCARLWSTLKSVCMIAQGGCPSGQAWIVSLRGHRSIQTQLPRNPWLQRSGKSLPAGPLRLPFDAGNALAAPRFCVLDGMSAEHHATCNVSLAMKLRGRNLFGSVCHASAFAGGWRHGITDARVFAHGNVTERFLELRCTPLALFSEGCKQAGMTWCARELRIRDRLLRNVTACPIRLAPAASLWDAILFAVLSMLLSSYYSMQHMWHCCMILHVAQD